MDITRRQGLTLIGGFAVAACGGGSGAAPPATSLPAPAPPPVQSPAPATPPATDAAPSLQSLAAAKGMRFGSCFAWSEASADRGSFANPDYARLLTGQCGLLVAENEMKWQALRPSADAFDFARADAMMAWADAQGLPVRGHNLLWHQPKWMPRWAEAHDYGARPAAEAERLLTAHVRTVAGRYAGRIRSWDVVNEAVRPSDAGLYDTALSRAMGGAEPTLDLAFRTARATLPDAELVYNDYMSWEPGNARHREGVLRLLEGFRRRNVPVDALGVQSHLVTQGTDAAGTARALEGDWRRFLEAVTAMGYRLLVTELDVRDNGLPVDPAVRDPAVAAFARAYLDVTLSFPSVRDVLAWGMTDRYSWIEGFEPRADRAPRRPCPYDRDFAPKPLRAAVADAIRAAPPRG